MGPIWGRQDPGGSHVGPWALLSGYIFIWMWLISHSQFICSHEQFSMHSTISFIPTEFLQTIYLFIQTTIRTDGKWSTAERNDIPSSETVHLHLLINFSRFLELFTRMQTSARKTLHCYHMRITASQFTDKCRKISNIRHTKSQNLNDSRLVLQLPLPNPLESGVKSRMNMGLEQHRQAMLQLHLSDQRVYRLLRGVLY